jgi:hypothetical protein
MDSSKAECKKRQIPVEIFVHDKEHPKHDEFVKTAKDVCRECPIQADCFLLGMQNGEVGIWGGTWLNLPSEDPTDKS